MKIIIILLLIFIGIGLYFYNVAIKRSKKNFLFGNEDLGDIISTNREDANSKWFQSVNHEDVEINSWDGLKLHGYFIEPKTPSDKIAILIHGYAGRAEGMSAFGKFYREDLNYNILMPDNRGHGKSDGNYIGFGWHDRLDCLEWINYIIDRFGEDSKILLHGISMGGATVLMTSGEDLPKNVKAIVSDCTYTSVNDQLKYQLKRMYKLPSFPILQFTSLITKIRAGYFFKDASALKQVDKSKAPILFVHGTKDIFVPYEMVNELYKNCVSEKDIFIVPDAQHGTAYRDDREGYEKKVIEFIGKYI